MSKNTTNLSEEALEQHILQLLLKHNFTHLFGPTIAPDGAQPERNSYKDVLLLGRLKQALHKLNPNAPPEAINQAYKALSNMPSQNLVANNEYVHKILTEGFDAEYMPDRVEDRIANSTRGTRIQIIDYINPVNNDFLVVNQYTIEGEQLSKRPDIVVFVNGIPLVVIELKKPTDENATIEKAYSQIQTYKEVIPQLFYYNTFVVISDGFDAKAGTISSDWSRFLAWKTADGATSAHQSIPQLETLVHGMLQPVVLLDILKQYTVFERSKKEDKETGLSTISTIKKIAAYHQYYAVQKAVDSTILAANDKGNHKAGVVWHTQGSGKSLSMVFYTGKIVLEMNNPTVVVLTDRNDLDDQLFETFANCKQLLRQEPVQAEGRDDLKKLLSVAGGGIIFTTIQKFFPADGSNVFEELSIRTNIVVIADEAHRSQYGFAAKAVQEKNESISHIKYGFAKYLRDALPNASYIGFTGTPIEKEDANTRSVFGDYIDIYDIQKAVEDGSTVRIYYESRLAKVHLKEEEREKLDEAVDEIMENEEPTATEKAKAKWAQLEAIVGHKERLKMVAEDILKHYDERSQAFEGKAMIVTMSRRIAVELYEQIINLRPEWHTNDLKKGALKVVMTSASSDPLSWQPHHTSKQQRKELGERFKDSQDELKLVIVRDMWLTGFDVPCMHTMYIDKPMKGHNLMQAIARVNRVYKDKPGGLIVDYIGIASDLKNALVNYTENGGQGQPTFDQEEAVATMVEKFEVVEQLLNGFNYKRYFTESVANKMRIILEAQEFILGIPDGKSRFIQQITILSKAFALALPHPKAMAIKDEIAFFQAVKARLVKFEPREGGKSSFELESAIRQIVDQAVVSDKVIDIFDAAGIKKPDLSILSDEFLAEVQGMERKNLAFELLKKILNDEIKVRLKRNLVQGRKMSEMLEKAIKKYQNNLLTSAQIIEELINMARDIREKDTRGEKLGLDVYELAFYDAVSENQSAIELLGNEVLRELARVLVQRVKANTSIDWTIKESVRSKLKVIVKRTLRQFGYPPDLQELAVELVLKQSELLANEEVEF